MYRGGVTDRASPPERLLVCIRPNPQSTDLLRAARRMADRLAASWIVAWVDSTAQAPLLAAEREDLGRALRMAEQLGADTAVLSGDRVSETLVAFALDRGVSKIVVGKPTHRTLRDRLRGSLLDDLARRSAGIDLYVLSGEGAEPKLARAGRVFMSSSPRHYLGAVAVVVLNTFVCGGMLGRFDSSNLIMVYLLGVAFVATRWGQGPSALTACLSVAAFDLFFVPPHLTFAVEDTQYVVTFAVMLVVGLLISRLAARVREQAETARQRELRFRALYGLSRDLSGLRAPHEIARTVSRHVAEVMRGPVAVLLPGADGRLAAQETMGPSLGPSELAAAQDLFEAAGRGGPRDQGVAGSAHHVLLTGGHGPLGVLSVRPGIPALHDHIDLLETVARVTAAALEREGLAAEVERTRLAAETERLRNALLSSVSHDLRTPLGVIEGAASTLLEDPAVIDGATRHDLVQTIHEEADRLGRQVRNLLDMTRLEAGALVVGREWESLEEVVGAALDRVERRMEGRRVAVDLPPTLLVPCDAVLLEQVFVNLLENALKYSPPESPIEISAAEEGGEVVASVADRGPGIPAHARDRVFEKFFRLRDGGGGGVGLGLAICRGIVAAHGGRIWVEDRPGGGARFRLVLPAGVAPEPPPTEPAA